LAARRRRRGAPGAARASLRPPAAAAKDRKGAGVRSGGARKPVQKDETFDRDEAVGREEPGRSGEWGGRARTSRGGGVIIVMEPSWLAAVAEGEEAIQGRGGWPRATRRRRRRRTAECVRRGGGGLREGC
jgi:hypothetical protein